MYNCKYPHIFSSIKINKMVLKNRIIATPVGDSFYPAKGGAAVVITHSMGVNLPNALWGPFDYAFSKYQREKTKEEILKAHTYGAKISIEIHHSGVQARVPAGQYCYGPCDMVNEDGCQVKAMDRNDMQIVIDAYVQAAKDAKKLGFDMLFLHFAHGWLAAQFISPLYNHRTDEFGGSLENRAKFPLMILKAVREAVGPDFPIDMRISSVEHVENSICFSDTVEFVKLAQQYIDTVQVSCGLDRGFGFKGNTTMASTIFEPHQINLEYAAELKKQVSIPVSVVGGFETPEDAENAIASGKVDMVAIGRAFIADPEWVNKARTGHEKEIVPCLRCLQCYHIATDHWDVGCSVNPVYHNESFVPTVEEVKKNEVEKNVVVIGAGPAGIKAAISADLKGNHVTLIEKQNEVGGMLRYISKEHYKEDVKSYFEYLKRSLNASKVNVVLNKTADKAYVESLKPDYVIVAIGSTEFTPKIKGITNENVFGCIEAIEKYDQLGNNIVIIGGGTNGAEQALALAEISHKNVTVVEMTDKIASTGNELFKVSYKQHADRCKNLRFLTNTTCDEITKKSVFVTTKDGKQEIPCDSVIIATGLKPNQAEAATFCDIALSTQMIGDCLRVRKIMDATFEGYTAGINTL